MSLKILTLNEGSRKVQVIRRQKMPVQLKQGKKIVRPGQTRGSQKSRSLDWKGRVRTRRRGLHPRRCNCQNRMPVPVQCQVKVQVVSPTEHPNRLQAVKFPNGLLARSKKKLMQEKTQMPLQSLRRSP